MWRKGMNKKIFGAALLAITCVVSAQTRPRTPFVFRTAINETNADRPSNNKNRLVAVLLSSNFTALYSTQDGSLYMTRSGTASDINRTYRQVTYGQVLAFSGGAVLHRNTSNQMWELLNNDSPVSSKNVYKGFTLKGNDVALRYAIVAGASAVNISETPEYVAGGSGGIRRTIVVSGLTAGQSVRLRVNGGVANETWTVQSGGTLSGTNPRYLTISENGTVILNGSWN
jgi:hypothetical protein